MKKLTILIDMDDTIENQIEVWVKCINAENGTNVSPDDIKQWDMTLAFPAISKDKIFEPLLHSSFWEEVTPLPGAVEYIKKLQDDGHKIIIVTASSPKTLQSKLDNVLFKYFPFIKLNDVIIAYQKQLINGDVLIDDAPHNLVGGRYRGILMSACHNQKYDAEANGFIRANNWEEAYKAVCDIAREE